MFSFVRFVSKKNFNVYTVVWKIENRFDPFLVKTFFSTFVSSFGCTVWEIVSIFEKQSLSVNGIINNGIQLEIRSTVSWFVCRARKTVPETIYYTWRTRWCKPYCLVCSWLCVRVHTFYVYAICVRGERVSKIVDTKSAVTRWWIV